MNQATIHAQLATPLPDSPPADIQWMPPGAHEITGIQGGKPVTVKVVVNSATAERLQRLLQDLRAKAAAGVEDMPYIDFNHEDGPAAGHITEFYWGGADPMSGGVRAKVEWTEPGKLALQGRAYRRFSPSFNPPNAAGEVTGAPMNMGGLVNRAAFKTITPIVAGGPGASPTESSMDTNEKLAADLAAANQNIIKLTATLEAQGSQQTISAKDAEITALKDKIKAYETAEVERVKVDAKSAVADAVAAGKLPPQDKELHAHYEAIFTANPAAGKAILAKLSSPAALGGPIIHGQTGQTKPPTPAEIWNAAFRAREAAATK